MEVYKKQNREYILRHLNTTMDDFTIEVEESKLSKEDLEG